MSVCRSHRGTWLEELSAHLREIVKKLFWLLVIVSLLCACSGKPIQIVKDYQATGVYHRVKPGENLNNIAKAYHIEVQKIIEANNITDPNHIEANSVIFIPNAAQVIDVVPPVDIRRPSASLSSPKAAQSGGLMGNELQQDNRSGLKSPVWVPLIQSGTERASGMSTIRIKPLKIEEHLSDNRRADIKVSVLESGADYSNRPTSRSIEPSYKPSVTSDQTIRSQPGASHENRVEPEHRAKQASLDPETESLQFDRKRFIWPVKGKVVSRFGIQPNGMYYNGITIVAGDGVSVAAAADGTVIYSGALKDYGETIIIKHEDQYATVYTRLGIRKVKMDDRVKQTDLIGHLGKAEEKGAGPRLNFEIRYQNKARNPMFFLP